MPWLRHRLRDADVWAKIDGAGKLLTDAAGRVEIVYKAEPDAKVYRASARNLAPVPGDAAVEFAASAGPASTASRRSDPPANAIHVWTDGACQNNPGPAGLGVVIVGDGDRQRELSEYLGQATNNIAELTAILRGLQAVSDKQRPVIVYSDSEYSIGVLTKRWKAKKNVELIAQLRALCNEFADLQFVKVLAHSGIPLNERVDQLAVAAISRRGNSDRRV